MDSPFNRALTLLSVGFSLGGVEPGAVGLDTYHRERSEPVRRKNCRELRLDPEEHADRLRDRFKRVSRQLDRASWLRRDRSQMLQSATYLSGEADTGTFSGDIATHASRGTYHDV